MKEAWLDPNPKNPILSHRILSAGHAALLTKGQWEYVDSVLAGFVPNFSLSNETERASVLKKVHKAI